MSSYAGIIATLIGGTFNALTGTGAAFLLSLAITSLTGWWFVGAAVVLTGLVHFGSQLAGKLTYDKMEAEAEAASVAAAVAA